jgi:hypothetical protein
MIGESKMGSDVMDLSRKGGNHEVKGKFLSFDEK